MRRVLLLLLFATVAFAEPFPTPSPGVHPRIMIDSARITSLNAEIAAAEAQFPSNFDFKSTNLHLQNDVAWVAYWWHNSYQNQYGLKRWVTATQWPGYFMMRQMKGADLLMDLTSANPSQWFFNATNANAHGPGSWKNWRRDVLLFAALTGNSTVIDRMKFIASKTADVALDNSLNHNGAPDSSNNETDSKQWMQTLIISYDMLYPYYSAQERQHVLDALDYYSRVFYQDYVKWNRVFGSSHSTSNTLLVWYACLSRYGDPNLPNQPPEDGIFDQCNKAYSDIRNNYYAIYEWLRSDSGGWDWGGGYDMWGAGDIPEFVKITKIATGFNAWPEIQPWASKIPLQVFYKFKPNGLSFRDGDGVANRNSSRPDFLEYLLLTGDKKFATMLNATRNMQYQFWHPVRDSDLLYFDYLVSMKPRHYNDVEPLSTLPTDWFANRTGVASMRSNWNENAVDAYFVCRQYKRESHHHADQGHFDIFYKGDALIGSGVYDQYWTTHSLNYYQRSVSKNTILIPNANVHYRNNNGQEIANDGGQRFFAGPLQSINGKEVFADDLANGITQYSWSVTMYNLTFFTDPSYSQYHKAGEFESFYSANDNSYAYARCDFGKSYFPQQASEVKRNFFFLKPNIFVVLDKIVMPSANQPIMLLHPASPNNVSDGLITMNGNDGFTAVNTQNIYGYQHQNQLRAFFLLPEQRSVQQVFNYTVGGQIYDYPRGPGIGYDTEKPEGLWRIEVKNSSASNEQYFLSVLIPQDIDAASPSVSRTVFSTGFEGARIDNNVVALSKQANWEGTTNFSVSGTGQAKIYFAGVKPNTQFTLVNVNLSGGGQEVYQVQSTSQGTASQTINLGSNHELIFSNSASCTDGTPEGACSANQPERCIGGSLTPQCSVCGCATGVCQGDGTCSFTASPSPSPSPSPSVSPSPSASPSPQLGPPYWSFIRIQPSGVITAESVPSADLLIFYNYLQTGLPAGAEAIRRMQASVNGVNLTSQIAYSKPGVFYVRVTPALLNLETADLPDGAYYAHASVTETINDEERKFSAFEPSAFIILKKKHALPETDFIAIAFFLLLALFLMRSRRKN